MQKHPNSGHRGRLLDRFEKSGIGALSEHEIVELLLTYVLPQRDVKPIAKHLLETFATVNGVLNALPDQLQATVGIGPRAAHLFVLIKELLSYCLREKYRKRPLISHRGDVEEYLRFQFGLKRDEYVAALFLDTGHNVITTDIIAEGTVNQCAVYPRGIIERALRNGAASFIMVHNHPAGCKEASEADWAITKRLYAVGELLEIPLLDHIIIAGESACSLREHPRWKSAVTL